MSLMVVDRVGNPELSRKRRSTPSNAASRLSTVRPAVLAIFIDIHATFAWPIVIGGWLPFFRDEGLERLLERDHNQQDWVCRRGIAFAAEAAGTSKFQRVPPAID